MNILVIDDNPNARKTLSNILKAKGFDVEEAGTGSEAVASCRAKFFNLVLIDVKLPDISGLEVLKAVRGINEDIVAIMMTGYATLDSSIEAMNNGAFSYITKPVNMEQTLIIIAKALEKQQLSLENKRLLKELAAVNEQQQIILDASPAMIFYKDKENRFIRVNEALAKATGLSKKEMEGKPLWDLYPRKAAEHYWQDDKEVMASGKPTLNIIEDMKTPQGTMLVQTDKIPYRNLKGEIIGIIGFAVDITERKLLQEKLLASEKLASMGRLIADVSHEINNPLAIILLALRRLEGMIKNPASAIPDLEDYTTILEKVRNAVNRCKKIVAGLLVFSRPTMLNLGATDINKIIEESLESLDEQVKSQNVKVVQAFAPNLPIIKADKQRLIQVFVNIITNAYDAMPAGGELRIATRLQTPDADAGGEVTGEESPAVEIEFTDTGEGIGKEDLFRIFDPFVSTKEVGKGVGLGLSISYGIVREHGGTISVSSEKGKGTIFIVRLPAKTYAQVDRLPGSAGERPAFSEASPKASYA